MRVTRCSTGTETGGIGTRHHNIIKETKTSCAYSKLLKAVPKRQCLALLSTAGSNQHAGAGQHAGASHDGGAVVSNNISVG